MANLEVINRENLLVPKALSTSLWVIYDDAPPIFYQGSPIKACDEILIAIKQMDRGGDFSFFLQRKDAGRLQVYADTALSIFQLLKRQIRFKHLSKFTLAAIEVNLSKEYLPPNLYSTNMVYLFCVHRKVEDVYVNIVYTFLPNLFSVI